MDQKAEQMAGELDSIAWHRTPIVLPSDLRRARNAAADFSDVTYEQAVWRGAKRAALQPVFGLAPPATEEPLVDIWRMPLASLAKVRAAAQSEALGHGDGAPVWS